MCTMHLRQKQLPKINTPPDKFLGSRKLKLRKDVYCRNGDFRLQMFLVKLIVFSTLRFLGNLLVYRYLLIVFISASTF